MRLGGQEQSGRGAAAAPLQYPDLSAALFKYQGVFFFPLPATEELLQCTGCSQSDRTGSGQDPCWPRAGSWEHTGAHGQTLGRSSYGQTLLK